MILAIILSNSERAELKMLNYLPATAFATADAACDFSVIGASPSQADRGLLIGQDSLLAPRFLSLLSTPKPHLRARKGVRASGHLSLLCFEETAGKRSQSGWLCSAGREKDATLLALGIRMQSGFPAPAHSRGHPLNHTVIHRRG